MNDLVHRKIECIKRLFHKNNSYNEMCSFLINYKLTTPQEASQNTRDQERAEFILSLLKEGEKQEKFQLVSFEWQILPIEQITIYIVTQIEEINFTFGH